MGDPDRLRRSRHGSRRRITLTLTIAAAAVILGAAACGGASASPDTPAEADPATPVVEVAAPSTTKGAEVAGPQSEDNTDPDAGWAPFPAGRPPSPAKLDIPECDAYFALVAQCLDAIGDKAGGMIDVQSMIGQIRETFRQVASTPEGRQQLAATCKMAQETMSIAQFCR
jgi:hypothetical protein